MQRLTAFLEERSDGRALGIARIMLGLAALLKGLITFDAINRYQAADALAFPYTMLDLSFPAGVAANAVGVIWVACALLFMIGLATRIAGALLAISIFLVIAIDQQFYSNHMYLLGTVVALMTIAGAGARYSLDARRTSSSGDVPHWAVTLIKLQLTSVYLFAALSKLNSDFLSGSILERLLNLPTRARLEQYASLETIAYLAVATELFLAFAFWFSSVRLAAAPIALGFHVANVVILDEGEPLNLSIFALVMFSMIVVFLTDELSPRGDRAAQEESPSDETVAATSGQTNLG